MSTKVTQTLKRLLRQLQTMKAMINAQIALIQRAQGALGAPREQRATKRARPSGPVGYARDRPALAARKRARKRR